MDGRELRQYQHWRDEAQFLRAENQHLRYELTALRPQSYQDGIRIGRLEERVAELSAENHLLKQRVADLTAQAKQKPTATPPSFVKANVFFGVFRLNCYPSAAVAGIETFGLCRGAMNSTVSRSASGTSGAQ